MSDLPEPMTPPDCDLRGYDFMPLFGQKLFGSRFYSLALRNPRAGLAGLKLWWEAWAQCPAGSLPDDDFDLARMADFGGDMKGWRSVKETALHGFIRCSDGRLYHPVLASEAIDAWERRRKERARKAEQRARRGGTGGGNTESVPQSVPRDTARTNDGTHHGNLGGRTEDGARSVRSDRTETGQDRDRTEKKEEDRSLRSLPRRPASAEADFDAFWAAYPRKVGKDAARRAFAAAVKRAPVADIAAGLNRQSWPSDPQFVPHPATWLNGGRWADDPSAAAPPRSSVSPAQARFDASMQQVADYLAADDDAPVEQPWRLQ